MSPTEFWKPRPLQSSPVVRLAAAVDRLRSEGHVVEVEQIIPMAPPLFRVDNGPELTSAQFIQVYGTTA